MNSWHALVGALATVLCAELCAADLSYTKFGRENPFSSRVLHEALPIHGDDLEVPVGFALVGIIWHAQGVDALIRLPTGVVSRLEEGQGLEQGGLRVLQVGDDWVRIELPEGSATLRLVDGSAGVSRS